MSATTRYLARFHDPTEYRKLFAAGLDQGMVFVGLAVEPQAFSQVQLRLEAPNGRAMELDGEVVQVMPGFGFACRIHDLSPEQIATLKGWDEPASNPTGPPVAYRELPPATEGDHDLLETEPDDDLADLLEPDEYDDDEDYDEDYDEQEDDQDSEPDDETKPLYISIREMSRMDKMRLAMRGDRTARNLLIRDPDKGLHPFLLKNPGVGVDEIAQWARMPGVNPEVLKQISTNSDYVGNKTVARALVLNPKTPVNTAVKLLRKLSRSDIRAIIRAQNVRPPVLAAARRMAVADLDPSKRRRGGRY